MLKRLREFMDDERGTLAFFIIFCFLAVILLILFAFGIPLAININTQLYTVGDELIAESSDTIANIQNETIRQQMQDALNSAQQSTADQVELLAWFYQYAWVWILIVIALTIFVYARRSVEYGGMVR